MPAATSELTDQSLLEELCGHRILVVGTALQDAANGLEAATLGYLNVQVDPRRDPLAWELY
jgi:hypothetical protein